MEVYIKCAIFSILKWNFQNINAVISNCGALQDNVWMTFSMFTKQHTSTFLCSPPPLKQEHALRRSSKLGQGTAWLTLQ